MFSSDGAELGTVAEVLVNEREDLFDGISVRTPGGARFVDAPEVGRITERTVTLTIDSATAAELPARDDKGAPEFKANVGGRFGRAWRRR